MISDDDLRYIGQVADQVSADLLECQRLRAELSVEYQITDAGRQVLEERDHEQR